jgi:hypothetical protein
VDTPHYNSGVAKKLRDAIIQSFHWTFAFACTPLFNYFERENISWSAGPSPRGLYVCIDFSYESNTRPFPRRAFLVDRKLVQKEEIIFKHHESLGFSVVVAGNRRQRSAAGG